MRMGEALCLVVVVVIDFSFMLERYAREVNSPPEALHLQTISSPSVFYLQEKKKINKSLHFPLEPPPIGLARKLPSKPGLALDFFVLVFFPLGLPLPSLLF